jgi:hypothetical protein
MWLRGRRTPAGLAISWYSPLRQGSNRKEDEMANDTKHIITTVTIDAQWRWEAFNEDGEVLSVGKGGPYPDRYETLDEFIDRRDARRNLENVPRYVLRHRDGSPYMDPFDYMDS